MLKQLGQSELVTIIRDMQEQERRGREIAETLAAMERRQEAMNALFDPNGLLAREAHRRAMIEEQIVRRDWQREAEAARRRRDEEYYRGGVHLMIQQRRG